MGLMVIAPLDLRDGRKVPTARLGDPDDPAFGLLEEVSRVPTRSRRRCCKAGAAAGFRATLSRDRPAYRISCSRTIPAAGWCSAEVRSNRSNYAVVR
jgi:hypothetical protein